MLYHTDRHKGCIDGPFIHSHSVVVNKRIENRRETVPVLSRRIHTCCKIPVRHLFHLADRPHEQLIGNISNAMQHDRIRRFGCICQGMEVFEGAESCCVDEICERVFEDNGDVGDVEIVPCCIREGTRVMHCRCSILL